MTTSLFESGLALPGRLRLHAARRSVGAILAAAEDLARRSDAELAERSLSLRYRARCGQSQSSLLVEAGGLVREAARRTLGLPHLELQLLAGVLLQRRTIAEMQTGEGKTLTATLPLFVHALAGRGAHLATANDYLARRDADWMRPVFGLLGMSVGVVVAGQSPAERRAAYASDVTYGTAREFGFDFLRDRLAQAESAAAERLLAPGGRSAGQPAGLVQRGLHYLLADEADSLLIDEAQMPLIISASDPESAAADAALFAWAAAAARSLSPADHCAPDDERRRVELTASGRQQVRGLGRPSGLARFVLPELYDAVERALRAAKYFLRERHYVVRDGAIVIVDEFTGRPAEGRQWRDGLHQAVQAQEGVPVTPSALAAAQITVPELFAQYGRLAGMTGTARSSAGEFRSAYGLRFAAIPTHRPCRRALWAPRVLANAQDKWRAIVAEARTLRDQGRPVLIGTRSIDKSEELSQRLQGAGIVHRVLHARNLPAEAEIIAAAGERGQVTVATNMAGRGTDIRLGPGVAELGGLHVIGTELHDAARIDRQLVGRCARQGDPGSFRQFLALDDEILAAGLGEAAALRLRGAPARGRPLDPLAAMFLRAQRRVERRRRADRQVLFRAARERQEQSRQMGLDPWL